MKIIIIKEKLTSKEDQVFLKHLRKKGLCLVLNPQLIKSGKKGRGKIAEFSYQEIEIENISIHELEEIFVEYVRDNQMEQEDLYVKSDDYLTIDYLINSSILSSTEVEELLEDLELNVNSLKILTEKV